MHEAMPTGRKVMILRALKSSGVAALLFAGMLAGSPPAAAQCGGCGGYAVAPVVVQPYYSSGCGCGGCCGGSAYYSAGYGYGYPGYGVAAGAYALDYGYAPSVVVGPGYYGRRGWRRGYWGY
jgi:hypothetical protein